MASTIRGARPHPVCIARIGEAGDAGEDEHVPVPPDLRDGEVQGVAVAAPARPDGAGPTPARARGPVGAEDLRAGAVEPQVAARLVAAGDRLPLPADHVEAARSVDEV